ncbi:hypothetical protein VNO77_26319 [Canavalia gladiata]|uniref:Uncharacterized protein n=1 Tax=Canavalia gladiata TaxID=3824 RepID=A0AAN9Q682_CANGL
MPRCGFFGSSPMMAFVMIPKILITTCRALCGAFNMDVAVCMDAWSLSIFLMLPGASSLHVGGSTRVTWVGRHGCSVEPCHGIESSKWAIFGKQNWRCGMNRKLGYGAQLRANLDPTKGVGRLRQQDGGHGSRNPLRSV